MNQETDLVVLSATPGGIMAAIAAADEGCRVTILERTANIGGLPANGLGATDIGRRGATLGLFHKFTSAIRQYYVDQYGADSEQVRLCSDGYHFEPHVAEEVLLAMLAQYPAIRVLTNRQFDAKPENVCMNGKVPVSIKVTVRDTGAEEVYRARLFIDATYEGDLAAACGAPFRVGREGRNELREPMAGALYQSWHGPYQPVGDGSGDGCVQAYNYRLCLTDNPMNRVPVAKPDHYDPAEYESLIEDVRLERWAGTKGGELHLDGIGRLTNMVMLPNGKTDSNNQHLAFLSTDLPEENYPWPTADWKWRDAFAKRQRDYISGLLYFAQNDERLPAEFRERCRAWGWAADEYADNQNFPRQIYVREGRRIEGDHLFTAHDALPVDGKQSRPPLHGTTITASYYPLDSHAVRKREPARPHLEGFLSTACTPYTVPYGVMLPKGVEGLLVPVAVSATHIGFSTMRMEPCWMALGEAAGVAAALALRTQVAPRSCDIRQIQNHLLQRGAVLVYVEDCGPEHPLFASVQTLAIRGLVAGWTFEESKPAEESTVSSWADALGVARPAAGSCAGLTRGEALRRLLK